MAVKVLERDPTVVSELHAYDVGLITGLGNVAMNWLNYLTLTGDFISVDLGVEDSTTAQPRLPLTTEIPTLVFTENVVF